MIHTTSSASATLAPVSNSVTALDVASCLIKIANNEIVDVNPKTGEAVVEGVTPLKLQKLVYYAQAAHLALYDKPLFIEKIYAWKYGPVIRSVYKKFKEFGNCPIPAREGKCDDKTLEEFIREVWKLFGKYSASELVNLTHQEAPYKDVFQEGVDDIVISPESMKIYYKQVFVLEDESPHSTPASAS